MGFLDNNTVLFDATEINLIFAFAARCAPCSNSLAEMTDRETEDWKRSVFGVG